MTRWRMLLGNERGVALVLSLMILLMLTGLVLAFLSVSAMEPQISRNLGDTLRARYLAEAGLEAGFNTLTGLFDANNTWTGELAGATNGNPWVVLPGLNAATLPGISAANGGTFTVSIRNDRVSSDNALTGETTAPEANDIDVNRVVFMRATGTFNGATKTLEVVVKRFQSGLPPFPGAVNVPGVQADTFISTQQFEIDGRDYNCTSNCDNQANWNVNNANPMKYGIATNTGIQSNISPTTYETNAENAIGPTGTCNAACQTAKKGSIRGKDQTNPNGPDTTGLNTIAPDGSLTPGVMAPFLSKLAANASTTILQSTMACPMILMGNSSDSSKPTLTNNNGGTGGASCNMNQTLDLGTRDNPKLVYFRGELDTSSTFTGLQLNTGSTDPVIKGAGVLVIEDGDFRQMGNFEWDGVVIVTGRYVGAGFRSSSTTKIRGAFTALETIPGEASGYFEFLLQAQPNSFSIRSSKQNLDMALRIRGLTVMSSWREI